MSSNNQKGLWRFCISIFINRYYLLFCTVRSVYTSNLSKVDFLVCAIFCRPLVVFSFTAKVIYPGRPFLRRLYRRKTFALLETSCVGKISSLMECSYTSTPSLPMLFSMDWCVRLLWYRRILLTWALHSTRVLQEHTYLQQNLFSKQSNRLQLLHIDFQRAHGRNASISRRWQQFSKQ